MFYVSWESDVVRFLFLARQGILEDRSALVENFDGNLMMTPFGPCMALAHPTMDITGPGRLDLTMVRDAWCLSNWVLLGVILLA